MQSGVTVSCFFLSYVIVLALELSRLYLRMHWRMVIVVLMAILGLVTHGLFLWDRWAAVDQSVGQGALPATLFDWSLLAAWVLAAIYVFLAIRRPTNAMGPFLLPLVLAMILGALSVRSGQPFDRTASTGIWRYIHGGSLSLGTVAVTLGLAAAMMNLVQEYRLKTKRGMVSRLRLPSLEYLHTLGRSCLVVTTISIACGLVSGVVLNFQRHGSVKWLESGIIFSGGLLVWLVIASILEWQAARRATSWAAYLNIASFLIVFLALVFVFAAPHGRPKASFAPRTLSPFAPRTLSPFAPRTLSPFAPRKERESQVRYAPFNPLTAASLLSLVKLGQTEPEASAYGSLSSTFSSGQPEALAEIVNVESVLTV